MPADILDETLDETTQENAKPTAAQTSEMVQRALVMLGHRGTDGQRPARVNPQGRVRAAIETFAMAGDLETLDARQVNLKAVLRDLLDWGNKPGEATRANGNVVKAVAHALQARDDQGRSLYAQGVEMLGLAAAVAPLLQPDRIARLIAEAPNVSTAYAPDRYTLRCTAALRSVLGRYTEERREALLKSLWHEVHDGRFWRLASLVTSIGVDPDAVERHRVANREVLDRLYGDVDPDSPQGHELLAAALIDGRLHFHPDTGELIAALPPTPAFRDQLRAFATDLRAGKPVNPDTAVLVSYLPWATPDERPESPVSWVLRQLELALKPCPVTGADPLLTELTAKPKSWAELLPHDVVQGFPILAAARGLHGRPLPGLEDAQCQVILDSAQLAENANFMGNCTASYQRQMESGTYVLFVVVYRDQVYNAAMHTGFHGNGTTWQVREINSRFNHGNVPGELREAFTRMVAQMPPAIPVEPNTVARPTPRTATFSML